MAHTIAAPRAARTATSHRQVSVYEIATREDQGKLILRLTVAILMLMHGIAKVTGGIEPIAGMLMQHGLPPELAYGAYVGEVLAPLLVIIGLWTRPAAVLMAVNMLFAIGLAHANDIFKLGEQGGWALELQGFYLFGSLAIALLGAGALSAGGNRGRWN